MHSKSHTVECCAMSKIEWEAFHAHLLECDPDEPPLLDRTEIEADMTNGRDALKAIKTFADFFDEHDTNVFAIQKLFSPNGTSCDLVRDQKYRQLICTMLGIKASGIQ